MENKKIKSIAGLLFPNDIFVWSTGGGESN
jgi:hypothetical protein